MATKKEKHKKDYNPNCPNCDIETGIMDVIGMPIGGSVYACRACGEMFLNDIAQEYYDGRFAGKGEFWMMGK